MEIFSLIFHKDIFLPFIWQKLKPGHKVHPPVSSVHCSYEYILLPVVPISILVAGLSHLQNTAGIIAVIIGAVGLLSMLTQSIYSLRGTDFKPTLGNFCLGFFLFFIMSGILSGLIIGHSQSSWYKLGGAALGMTIGYFVGILAGMWGQYLGWMGIIIEYICWITLLGMTIPVILLAIP